VRSVARTLASPIGCDGHIVGTTAHQLGLITVVGIARYGSVMNAHTPFDAVPVADRAVQRDRPVNVRQNGVRVTADRPWWLCPACTAESLCERCQLIRAASEGDGRGRAENSSPHAYGSG
jgi:hypothetical protein